jgi:hypothetical protein
MSNFVYFKHDEDSDTDTNLRTHEGTILSLISLARYRGSTIVLYHFRLAFHLTILGIGYMAIHV